MKLVLTGDKLESLDYEITYDHPDIEKIGGRQFIWTDGKHTLLTTDMGNDNYCIVRRLK